MKKEKDDGDFTQEEIVAYMAIMAVLVVQRRPLNSAVWVRGTLAFGVAAHPARALLAGWGDEGGDDGSRMVLHDAK